MSVFGSSAADMVVNYDFFVLGYDFWVPCHGRPGKIVPLTDDGQTRNQGPSPKKLRLFAGTLYC
jgi:hypothetical protein